MAWNGATEGRDWTLMYSGVTCCERQKNGVGFFSTSSVQKPGLEFSVKKKSGLLGTVCMALILLCDWYFKKVKSKNTFFNLFLIRSSSPQ